MFERVLFMDLVVILTKTKRDVFCKSWQNVIQAKASEKQPARSLRKTKMTKIEPPPDCPDCKARPLPPGYAHYTFSDDDGCPCVSANVRLTEARGVFTYDEAQEHYNAHPDYREARSDLAVAEGPVRALLKLITRDRLWQNGMETYDKVDAWLKEQGE